MHLHIAAIYENGASPSGHCLMLAIIQTCNELIGLKHQPTMMATANCAQKAEVDIATFVQILQSGLRRVRFRGREPRIPSPRREASEVQSSESDCSHTRHSVQSGTVWTRSNLQTCKLKVIKLAQKF